jgi:hypothetical protein
MERENIEEMLKVETVKGRQIIKKKERTKNLTLKFQRGLFLVF